MNWYGYLLTYSWVKTGYTLNDQWGTSFETWMVMEYRMNDLDCSCLDLEASGGSELFVLIKLSRCTAFQTFPHVLLYQVLQVALVRPAVPMIDTNPQVLALTQPCCVWVQCLGGPPL